jgi:hypothetical protein
MQSSGLTQIQWDKKRLWKGVIYFIFINFIALTQGLLWRSGPAEGVPSKRTESTAAYREVNG